MSFGDIFSTIPVSKIRQGLEAIKALLVVNYIAADAVVTTAREEVGLISIVTLDTAALIALGTTAIVLVPAPGAGKYIVVEEVSMFLEDGGTDFTAADVVDVRYQAAGGGAVCAGPFTVAFMQTSGSDAWASERGIDCVPEVNQAVSLYAAGAVADGDGNAIVTTKYRIVDHS